VPLLAVAGDSIPHLRSGKSLRSVRGKSSDPFGLNNERLEEMRPDLVNALRELELHTGKRELSRGGAKSGASGRRGCFWQGLQYAWWKSAGHGRGTLPYESKNYDDSAMAEMPR